MRLSRSLSLSLALSLSLSALLLLLLAPPRATLHPDSLVRSSARARVLALLLGGPLDVGGPATTLPAHPRGRAPISY
jgi:hypothetical protein